MRTVNRRGWLAIAAAAVLALGGVWILQAAADRREADLDAAAIAVAADPAQAAATARWQAENRKAL